MAKAKTKTEEPEAESSRAPQKRVRYIGDGAHYVPGRPAVLGAIEAVTATERDGLVGTGLYEVAPDDAEPGIPENVTKADIEGEGTSAAASTEVQP